MIYILHLTYSFSNYVPLEFLKGVSRSPNSSSSWRLKYIPYLERATSVARKYLNFPLSMNLKLLCSLSFHCLDSYEIIAIIDKNVCERNVWGLIKQGTNCFRLFVSWRHHCSRWVGRPLTWRLVEAIKRFLKLATHVLGYLMTET